MARKPIAIEDPYEEKPKGESALEMLANFSEKEDLEQMTKSDQVAQSSEDLVRLAEEMKTEQEEYQRLEAEAKQHKDRYNQIRTSELPELMKKLGLVNSKGKGSFTFGGGRVHLETKLAASCAAANKPKLFEWLKANEAADIVRPDVHPQTLTAFVRDRREEGLPDPPGVAVWEETRAKMTKL